MYSMQKKKWEAGRWQEKTEDGIPAEWYKTMGARVTKPVYKDEIDRDASPIEGQYPSALAHLMSDAYTQVHKDGEAPMGMRTAIISSKTTALSR